MAIKDFNKSTATKISGWSKGLMESKAVTGLKTTFNTLKAPFVAIGEFITGKKIPRPAGMPPMLSAPSKVGGLGRILGGMGEFLSGIGTKVAQTPGVARVLGLLRTGFGWLGKAFWPLTALIGIYDGVMQWRTGKDLEEFERDTIMEKVVASVSRAVAEFVGFFLDLPADIITWISDKAGLGKEWVHDNMSGEAVQVDKSWLKEARSTDWAGWLFRRIYDDTMAQIRALGDLVMLFIDPPTGKEIMDSLPLIVRDPLEWFINLFKPFEDVETDIAKVAERKMVEREIKNTREQLETTGRGDEGILLQFKRAVGMRSFDKLTAEDILAYDPKKLEGNPNAQKLRNDLLAMENDKKRFIE